jgi:predicted nuclease of restriction endonuclease-like (RecB) superfamily
VLAMQIDSGLYQRQGGAITNFPKTLPAPQSDLAQQIVKDPYNLDFLTISKDAKERELERGLIEHIRDFLLELGVGFAFMGSQYPLVVDDKEYRLDLLFYHAKLHCYIIIDLKMSEFEPSFSGQMNFYISAVNHTIRSAGDNPTIGIILCRSQSKMTVEFALDTVQNPIGVSTYKLRDDLPPALKDSLPTAEQLEMELNTAITELAEQTQTE